MCVFAFVCELPGWKPLFKFANKYLFHMTIFILQLIYSKQLCRRNTYDMFYVEPEHISVSSLPFRNE